MNGTALVPKLPGSLKVTGNSASGTPMTTTIPTLNALEKRLYIRRTGNGRVRAASADPTVADVRIVDDDYLVVTGRKKGLTQITVSMEEGTRHRAPQDFTFDVNCHSLPTGILSQDTWEQMREAANAGVADKFWKVGDLSALVQLNGPIAGTQFNLKLNYRLVNLTPWELTFLQAQNEQGVQIALCDAKYETVVQADDEGLCINRQNRIGSGAIDTTLGATNRGGYAGSYADSTVMYQYYMALPASLRNYIASKALASDNAGIDDNSPRAISYSTAGTFVPSQVEIRGNANYANSALLAHLAQWMWFAKGNSLQAFKSNKPTERCKVWLRDASVNGAGYSRSFRLMNDTGTATTENWACDSRGILAAFRIGDKKAA